MYHFAADLAVLRFDKNKDPVQRRDVLEVLAQRFATTSGIDFIPNAKLPEFVRCYRKIDRSDLTHHEVIETPAFIDCYGARVLLEPI